MHMHTDVGLDKARLGEEWGESHGRLACPRLVCIPSIGISAIFGRTLFTTCAMSFFHFLWHLAYIR